MLKHAGVINDGLLFMCRH